jgi:hypothetical protein
MQTYSTRENGHGKFYKFGLGKYATKVVAGKREGASVIRPAPVSIATTVLALVTFFIVAPLLPA